MPEKHRFPFFRAALVLALVPVLLLESCAPAIVTGIVLLLSQSDSGSGCSIPGSSVNVSFQGTIRFQKRLSSQTGAVGLEPFQNGKVEILRLNCGEKVLASARTDSQGFYSVAVSTPSGSVLQVSAVTELLDPGSSRVIATVRNNTTERLLYSFEGSKIHLTKDPDQAMEVDIDVPIECRSQPAGAFNLLDEIRIGLETIEGTFPPPDRSFTVVWELGDPDGTFFSISSRDLDGDGRGDDPHMQIRGGLLRSGCQNTDPFDGGVVLHEFGHFVAFLHSRDDSPGGPHAIGELTDPRLAWSEGWANFFSSMVRVDPILEDTCEQFTPCSWPCDGACGFAIDLGNPDASCSSANVPGACCAGRIGSEDAVGAFLWSLFDPAGSFALSRTDILLALEALKGKSHHFVYVGDFVEEIENQVPGRSAAIAALARDRNLADSGGQPFPFPEAFTEDVQSGNSVHASVTGRVNGCDGNCNLLSGCVGNCKAFAENFLGSSDFYELDIPGSPGQSGTLAATLSVTPIDSCSPNLELRIYNPTQALLYTATARQGSPASIDFSFDSNFPRGSPFLFEAAGDMPPAGSNRGQKADYVLTVDVQ